MDVHSLDFNGVQFRDRMVALDGGSSLAARAAR
jgi:hypothetical protein